MNEEQQELNLDQEDPVQDAVPGGAVETIVPTDGASPEYADSVQPSQIAEAVSSVESLPILSVNELRLHSMTELQQMAENTSLRNIGGLTKSQLVFELGRLYLREGRDLVVEGVMEQAKDNYAMLRDPVKSFRTSPDDIYVSGAR